MAMREAGHRAVRVDFSKVATVGDVAARVIAAYSELPTDPTRVVRRWAARFSIDVSVPGVRIGFRQTPPRPPTDEARAALLQLLDVPRELFEVDKNLTVICFDEFQDLLVADDSLDGLFRSVIQHHGEAAAYVFAGSQPSLMQALFSEYERPFYGQARPLELPPLPVDEAANDIEALITADGLEAGSAIDELLVFTGGHPQRTILLAYHLYDLLDRGQEGDDPAAAAIEVALEETRDAHQALWDALERNERVVLMALGDGRSPVGRTLADEHRIPRSTLQATVDRLVADQRHVQRDADGSTHLLDPLLAEWLRRR